MNHVEVQSSMLKSIAYDEESSTMEVKFHNGRKYTYENVTPDQHSNIMNAESVGRAFNLFLGNR